VSPSSEAPLVSVVTPSYNYGRFIGACLESVRIQTHPRIEHLVLDALSTDDTPAVLASYSGRYGVSAWFERDGGQADALNRGFARARGDILGWLNADDFYLHERVVADAVAVFEREPAVDVVTAGGAYVDVDGRRLRDITVRPDRVTRHLAYYDTILQPATFWRRRVHRALDDRLHYAFDWKLFLDMARHGASIRCVPASWAAYRLHGINKSAMDPARRRLELADLMREIHGERSLQHRWARLIYRAFEFSERRRLPLVKRGAQLANEIAHHATGRRVAF
jgi:glycosyltransferase involved in cell wall biosynthesis